MTRDILGLIVIVSGIGAGVFFGLSAHELSGLESVSGDSLAEAYYHKIALAMYGAALAIVSLSLGLGALLIFGIGHDESD